MTSALAREVWWVWVPGEVESKERICVVMRVDGDYMTVAYGQGKPDPLAPTQDIVISPETREGRILQVSKHTYFRARGFTHVKATFARRRIGMCPPKLFGRFAEREEVALKLGWLRRGLVVAASPSASIQQPMALKPPPTGEGRE